MNLSCYIIDDEPLAIEVLQSHIENMGNITVKGTFQNPAKAFQALHQETVDLLLLDIQMPGLTGIDLLKSLANPPMVIFTTAHREYALTGFELDVIDYLLKPISFERFLQAIGKVYKYRSGGRVPQEGMVQDPFLYVQAGGKTMRILLDEIVYIESQRDYVHIVTNAKTIKVQEKTTVLEKKLGRKGFLRIHRSFIVPVARIESWSPYEVEVNGHILPVGRTFSHGVLNVLKTGSGNL